MTGMNIAVIDIPEVLLGNVNLTLIPEGSVVGQFILLRDKVEDAAG
jgi:hypothetical protein